jgi:hypothetical protein
MPDDRPVPEMEQARPLTIWDAVMGYVFVIPSTAAVTVAVLALLSTAGIIPPRQNMFGVAVTAFVAVALIYGPFWKMRRHIALRAGFASGVAFAVLIWWALYGS